MLRLVTDVFFLLLAATVAGSFAILAYVAVAFA
jgi:hypothetical protein